MTDRDIFDLLRAGDPASPVDLPGPDSPLARSIRATVMANAVTTTTLTRRRKSIVVVVVAALLATAAAWVLAPRDVSNPEGILCYEAPTLDAAAIIAPRDTELTPQACAQFWNDGNLPIDEGLRSLDLPTLVGCVTESGTLAVFPSEDDTLCARLGLAEPAMSAIPDPLVILQQQLTEAINPQTCVTVASARPLVQNALDLLNLENWTVQTQPDHPDRPCTSISIDTTTKTIVIIPVPKS